MPAPGGSSRESSVDVSGDRGERIYNKTHNDIDESTLDLRCRQGACEVTLQERIWYEWVERESWRLGSDDRVNDTIEVDSDIYDGDHRVVIVATEDDTRVRGTFKSKDR